MGSTGPGGWAFWCENTEESRVGNHPETTNQRMELQAAFEAMRFFHQPLRIISDSRYVVNCFHQKWYVKWMKNGWRSSQKKPVMNQDLWQPMIEHYLEKPEKYEFKWVRGHTGVYGNEMADRLAVEAKESLTTMGVITTGSVDRLIAKRSTQ